MKKYVFEIKVYASSNSQSYTYTREIDANSLEEARAIADDLSNKIPFGTENQPIYLRGEVVEVKEKEVENLNR